MNNLTASNSYQVETGDVTLADHLFGRINNQMPAHGRSPNGVQSTTAGMAPDQVQQKIIETHGAQALITPKGNIFWALVMIGAFLVLNDKARKGK